MLLDKVDLHYGLQSQRLQMIDVALGGKGTAIDACGHNTEVWYLA